MYLAKALAPYGINTSQYLFILVLCKEPGITQDKLPERIGINKSNVTRTLAQLEKAGFIQRRENPQDKRTTTVHPTSRAYEAYPHIMRIVQQWDASVTEIFAENEKLTLQALLERMAASAKAITKTEIITDEEDGWPKARRSSNPFPIGVNNVSRTGTETKRLHEEPLGTCQKSSGDNGS